MFGGESVDRSRTRKLVRQALAVRRTVVALAVIGLIVVIPSNTAALDAVLRVITSSPDDEEARRDFVTLMQEAYAYVLLWFVVVQAAVAAAASGTAQSRRTMFRWSTLVGIALFALAFPAVGGWEHLGLSFWTFLIGALVVAVFDATVGDVDVDYLPVVGNSKRVKDTVWFLAPVDNVAAIYSQVGALPGCRVPHDWAVHYARSSRSGGQEAAKLGALTLRVEPVNTRLCVVRVTGRLTAEHLDRLDVVRSILGDPTTERDDPTRIHVRASVR